MPDQGEYIDAVQALPGCGLGLYTGVLAIGCSVGLLGILFSTLALIQAESSTFPQALRPGNQVPVWQLAPLRQSGVVELTEVPLAYHDASPRRDGTRACALMSDRLVQVIGETGTTLPYAEMTAVTGAEDAGSWTVSARGAQAEITCGFAPMEGGDRFLRQLRAEAPASATPAPSPPASEATAAPGATAAPPDAPGAAP